MLTGSHGHRLTEKTDNNHELIEKEHARLFQHLKFDKVSLKDFSISSFLPENPKMLSMFQSMKHMLIERLLK